MNAKRLSHHAIIALAVVAACNGAVAAEGDVFVPAHRTRDGSYVPPNVSPLSGGNHMARRPTRGRPMARRPASKSSPGITAPVFASAKPLRR